MGVFDSSNEAPGRTDKTLKTSTLYDVLLLNKYFFFLNDDLNKIGNFKGFSWLFSIGKLQRVEVFFAL